MAWFRAGGGGIPSSLKSDMNDVFNKKFGTVLQDYPPEDWPGTVNLMGPLPERKVSGAVVTFPDGADDVPLKSCAVTIAPTLDGVSSVDVVSAGKNLLNYADISLSYRVTSITENSSGSFTVVASGSGAYIDHVIKVKAGQAYCIKCTSATNDEGNASQIGAVNVYDGSDDTANLLLNGASISYSQKVFTPTGNYILLRNKVTGGSGAGTGTIVEPQLEVGSTATAYTPYVAPTTHTANLGRTIYGGEVDVVNGTGTKTHDILRMDSFNWAKSSSQSNPNGTYFLAIASIPYVGWGSGGRDTALCNELTKASSAGSGTSEANNTFWWNNLSTSIRAVWGSPNGGSSLEDFLAFLTNSNVIICGELSTPEAFTFDPVPIDSMYGDNTMWSDNGDIEVTYRRDIDLALA